MCNDSEYFLFQIKTDNETKLQELQRCALSMIFGALRIMFCICHASSKGDIDRVASLGFLVRRYRRLKTLFHCSTITPTSATIFFELVPQHLKVVSKGLPPTVASMQGNERKGHTTKKEYHFHSTCK